MYTNCREDEVNLIKRLWDSQPTTCPRCGNAILEYLHKKAKRSDYVINPYIGCPHACKYCYACFMKRFTKHLEDWGTFIDIKHCAKPISKKRLEGKTVFLSSVTDCYNPYEEKHCITRSILRQLVDIDCTVNISTKSALILRDIDLLKNLKNLTVSISINTMDESFKNDMDNASSIKSSWHEPFHFLQKMQRKGIKTMENHASFCLWSKVFVS